ncbi:beclin 1-associated autophagy-related key regulator-like [Stegodyphus dumicola]|uniref:beclin 1-associated autophagy-related key regulator-like n=1 Tax=Stegodyphus dumicola TaxID=202533 RepID=UPI0015AEE37F|nr:beclin 1-associated autophagy-related key regulator-like [Stegodyphus dumicola]
MASSSDDGLDDSVPEIISPCVSISIIDGTCKREDLHMKCPVCKQFRKCFNCDDCVRNGNYTHSKKKCLERYADKKHKELKLTEEKDVILQRFEHALSKKKKIENVKLDIYKCKEKIYLLKESIKSCKEEILKGKKRIKELERKKAVSLRFKSEFLTKLSKMHKCQEDKNFELRAADVQLYSVYSALKTVIHHRTNELITHIFPITKVSSHYYKDSASEEGQCAELEEAQKTTYVQGQWVIASSPMDDTKYSVVEPCIPSNGDYSAYIDWCSSRIQGISRNSLSRSDRHQFDAAYGISAALAYTAQLVGILALYLDAHVPKRSSFSEFCGHITSKKKFLHKVAKLNANIIHLCLAQGVDISNINAHQTISNLLLIFDPEARERQRCSPLEEESLVESIEMSISRDLLPIDESDSDDTESEYVHVSEEDILESPEAADSNEMHMQASFVSSVFSFWRAATGQK